MFFCTIQTVIPVVFASNKRTQPRKKNIRAFERNLYYLLLDLFKNARSLKCFITCEFFFFDALFVVSSSRDETKRLSNFEYLECLKKNS